MEYKVDNEQKEELHEAAVAAYGDFAPGNVLPSSAERSLSFVQAVILTIALFGFFYFSITHIQNAICFLIIVANLIYAYNTCFRSFLCVHGILQQKERRMISLLPDAELPRYTIMLPMYKEGNVALQLIKNFKRIDYPKDKLEILIILEADDEETIRAINQIELDHYFTPIIVPDSHPKTKPKACNYALKFGTGEIIAVFDADDIPNSGQLRAAVSTFREAGEETVCVQAKLNYYNRQENYITHMFAIEYSLLFDFMLPALEKFNWPIPLGGSSNHIKAKFLKEVGGWDAFNVTEDADLGVRIAKAGKRIKILHSYTLEEAPIGIYQWMKQRTRWLKGHIQTALVHSRKPLEIFRQLGFWRLASFIYCLFTSVAAFFLTPLILALLFFVEVVMRYDIVLSPLLYQICLINVIIGSLALIVGSAIIQMQKRQFSCKLWWSFPIYFMLHMVASILAIKQLISHPHYWNKTNHGVTKIRNKA